MKNSDEREAMFAEVLEGLNQPQKALPSKYFYDEKGSKLFDEITELNEYYPTRTEWQILESKIGEIERYLGDDILLIEPGSGSSDKTRVLLDQVSGICCYIPIDISGDYLQKVAGKLRRDYPSIQILPLQADYTQSFKLPASSPEARRVVFFPGSTIGNFKLETVQRFLKVISEITGRDGALLIGVDLKKDIEILEAAYNDSKGITAAFNKNILHHINRVLDAGFEASLFEHKAFWDEGKSRIEMHLICQQDHEVQINGTSISFKKGETIHTENSHKYSLKDFEEIVSPWFTVKKVWMDEEKLFSVQFLEPAGD
ncbi:MAG: L-histidine N(alpha)-methyltransferase [Balneolaceae bacterium]